MCFESYCNNIGCVFQLLEYFKFLKQVLRKPSLKKVIDNTISYKVEKKVCCRKVKFIFNN